MSCRFITIRCHAITMILLSLLSFFAPLSFDTFARYAVAAIDVIDTTPYTSRQIYADIGIIRYATPRFFFHFSLISRHAFTILRCHRTAMLRFMLLFEGCYATMLLLMIS